MFKLLAILLALGVVGFAFVFLVPRKVATVDLGVSASQESLASFLAKIGNAPPSGIMAGGMPIGGSFTNSEVTSFLVAFAKEHRVPIQNLQVRFSDGFFEASAIVQKIVKGDVFIKGTIELKGPRDLSVRLREVTSNILLITPTLKDTLEEAINTGIRDMFDKFAPDERFLNIHTLTLQQDVLLFEGVVPLEFLPSGSRIRF